MDLDAIIKVATIYGPLGAWAVVSSWAFWRQLEKTERAHDLRLEDHKQLIDAATKTRESVDANTRALEMLSVKIERSEK